MPVAMPAAAVSGAFFDHWCGPQRDDPGAPLVGTSTGESSSASALIRSPGACPAGDLGSS
jgi:hypothetical protein